MYAVIMAGGGGTRLWPLSRPERPKPFLPLLGDRTLIQETVARLRGSAGGRAPLVAPGDTYVVTDRRYGSLVREQLPDVAVLEEPRGRNTAAAIALATLAVDRPDDEVMVVLPADHVIADEVLFRQVLFAAASGLAGSNPFGVGRPLVTLGIRPTRPATEYGYVLPRQAAGLAVGGLEAYPVARFEEKPDASRASELLLETGVAWNAGMFLWQRASIRAALAEYTPLVDTLGPLLGRPRHLPAADRLAAAYEELEPISIDRAVLEPAAAAGRVLMGALDVGWSDIGGWHALLEALPGSGDSGSSGRVVPPGEWVTLLPDDLLVHSDGSRLVVTTGPSDGLVLDSHGALLVGARERAADIEALIARVAAASAGTTAEAPSMEAERT